MKKKIEQSSKSVPFEVSDDYKSFIQCFVVGMPTNCVILEYIWLFDPLKVYAFEYSFSIYFMLFCYVMVLISYYQCTNIKNYAPFRKPPHNNNLINNEEKNSKICDVCKSWRPHRAVHCINCNMCTLKYDHHCPWIFNCVGLRNHKAFYLFTFYLMLGALQYCWRSIYYFSCLYDINSKENPNYFFYFYWISTSFFLFPLTMMFVGLSFFHFMLAIKNLTSEEPFEEQFFQVPCLPSLMDIEKPNYFDRGFFSNITNFLGNSYLLFWYPTKCAYENDGSINMMIPQPNAKDVQENLGVEDIYRKPEELAKNKHDFLPYLNEIQSKYKTFNFKINDKYYEFWKKLELES